MPAHSTLVVTSDGVAVYDTVADTYWLRDLTIFINKTYFQQVQAIGDFSPGQWRMAALSDLVTLDANPDAEIAATFIPTLARSSVGNVEVASYGGWVDFAFGGNEFMVGGMIWDLTNDTVYSSLQYLGSGSNGSLASTWGSWVVSIGPYQVVPEPSTALLLASGLSVLAVVQRRRFH